MKLVVMRQSDLDILKPASHVRMMITGETTEMICLGAERKPLQAQACRPQACFPQSFRDIFMVMIGVIVTRQRHLVIVKPMFEVRMTVTCS